MAAVFLSYSREDQERVHPLADCLERAGHNVWWDPQITGGEEFSGAIEQALESAEAVVVAWSSASVKSAWVRDEAGAGRDSGRLVPVTLDGCMPPLGFRQFHTIDLSNWRGRAGSAALQPVLDAIDKAASRASGAKSTPAPAKAIRKLHGVPRRTAVVAGALAGLLVARSDRRRSR